MFGLDVLESERGVERRWYQNQVQFPSVFSRLFSNAQVMSDILTFFTNEKKPKTKNEQLTIN